MDAPSRPAMEPYTLEFAKRLEDAIASGELTREATIEGSADKLLQLLDLDLVELDMAVEERWTGPRTISRLIEFLRDMDSGEADFPLVKK
jgi:hypothetical protein